MTTLNVYLYFRGNCEKAFDFYKGIFKVEYDFIGRYKDVPIEARENYPYCSDEQIMHVSLPISKETILMGADLINLHPDSPQVKNVFALYLSTEDRVEADRIFNALSDEGEIVIPLDYQFWGSYYGQCIDKFGISWKISCAPDKQRGK